MTARSDPLAIDTRRLLDGLADAVIVADTAGKIVFVNATAVELLGTKRGELVDQPLVTIIPERLRSRHLAGFARYLSTGVGTLIGAGPVRLPALRADGSEIQIELTLSSHRNEAGEEVFVGTLRNLADRVELERQRDIARYLNTGREVTSRLALSAEATSLEEAAPVLLAAIGEGLRWDGGTVWRPRGGVLHPIAHWSAVDDDLAPTMTSGIRLAPGEGLAGTVFESQEPMWVETVSTSTVFLRGDRAKAIGVRSCFAFPIFVSGQVDGVVEMYSRAPQAPEPELLAVLQAAGLEIGRYLERAQSRRHVIELAEALQASLLPPSPPMVPGLDVAVRYRAAAGEGQIGGDFFDVFPLPDGEWAVFIGDVSGRGARAAALTALARYTLRAAAVGAASPSDALKVLNDVVRRELDGAYEGSERFLTVAYLVITRSGDGFGLSVACGGHPFPLVRRANGEVEEVRCEGELIGSFEAHQSKDETVQLHPGDLVVLFTDGVTEARCAGVEFGHARLRRVIAEATAATASELADAIEQRVLDHLGGCAHDDLAIVVLRLPPLDVSEGAAIDVRVGEVEATPATA